MRAWLIYIFIVEVAAVSLGSVIEKQIGRSDSRPMVAGATHAPEVQQAQVGLPMPAVK